MNINEIKNKVNSEEYDFLRTNPILKDNICLLTLGGSYGYGTCNENSDLDIRGIFLHSPQEILTMNYSEKPFEERNTDTVIYPLKQLIKLLISANPNVLEILCTKEEHLLICNNMGKLLRDNINLFLSQKAINSFSGYAFQQLKRLEHALARNEDSQDIKEKDILKSINRKILTMKDRYKEFTNEEINLYVDTSKKNNLNSEIFMDINLKHYSLRDFKNVYNEMNSTIRDFDSINHRNNKKDEEHLRKHCMHLMRLSICVYELLTTGKLNTYMGEYIPLLLDIRNGKYSYEQIFEMYKKYEKEIEYAKSNTILPNEPDYNKINELMIEINSNILKNYLK